MTQLADAIDLAGGAHKGVLVALWLDKDVAKEIAVPGGEPAKDLHITLCYCDGDIEDALPVVEELAKSWAPLVGNLDGVSSFEPSESSDGKRPVYAVPIVDGLDAFRGYLADALEEAGVVPKDDFGGYVPHITLKYIDEDAEPKLTLPPNVPLIFDSVWVVQGEEHEFIFEGGEIHGAGTSRGSKRAWVTRKQLRRATAVKPKRRPPRVKKLASFREKLAAYALSGTTAGANKTWETRWHGDGKADRISAAIIESGVGSDYVHELYSDDPEDAILTNFKHLNTVRAADIDKARAYLKNVSQALLRETHGDTVTAYRGTTGTEGKRATVSLTLSEHTAKFHARGKPVEKFKIAVDDVLGYSEAIGKGTFAEEEIVVLAKDAKHLSFRDKLNAYHLYGTTAGADKTWETRDRGKGDSADGTKAEAAAGGRGGDVSTSAAKGKGRPPEANKDVTAIASSYNEEHGRPPVDHSEYVEVDQQRAMTLADLYDALPKDDSANPEVKAAYHALGEELQQQWDYAIAHGYTFEPWKGEGQPYATSTEMAADVAKNKHLFFYTGGEKHPLLGEPDKDGLSLNDKFRAIHDLYGHASAGVGFGPRGEENAWRSHSQMFSPLARRAMTTETRGQNSWVNFGRQNYDADGNFKNIAPADRPFAEQKVALLPEKYALAVAHTFREKLIVYALYGTSVGADKTWETRDRGDKGDSTGAGKWPIADDATRTHDHAEIVHMKESHQKWLHSLPAAQYDALNLYIAGDNSYINMQLRGMKVPHPEKSANEAELITKAIAAADDLPKPTIVWRGIHVTGDNAFAHLAENDVIQLKGFQSTSLDPYYVTRFNNSSSNLILEIKPKHGAYLSGVNFVDENEFLMPHDAKFRVAGRKTVKVGAEKREVLQLEEV